MIHSHARCDRCEKNLIPLDDEGVTEDYVLDAGWLILKWVEGDDEDSVEESRDFCSLECAARWCADNADAPVTKGTDDRAGA